MTEALAPVAVFCYNRKDKLEACLSSLAECEWIDGTKVIVFSDGFKENEKTEKIDEVRAFIHEFVNNHTELEIRVVERDRNLGLAKSIIQGVTEIIQEYGKIIVVEDDLILSRDFLVYMNDALKFYEANARYGSISAYTYPLKQLKKYNKDIYIIRKGDCWGWATWLDRWDNVDWELKDFNDYLNNKKKRREFTRLEIGLEEQLILQHEKKLDAWAARWCFHLFNHNLLTVYPRKSRVTNIGIDGSGTNCEETGIDYNGRSLNSTSNCVFEELDTNTYLEKRVAKYGTSFYSLLKYRVKKEIELLKHKS